MARKIVNSMVSQRTGIAVIKAQATNREKDRFKGGGGGGGDHSRHHHPPDLPLNYQVHVIFHVDINIFIICAFYLRVPFTGVPYGLPYGTSPIRPIL